MNEAIGRVASPASIRVGLGYCMLEPGAVVATDQQRGTKKQSRGQASVWPLLPCDTVNAGPSEEIL